MRAEIPSLASLCLCSQALCHSFVDNSTHLLTIFHKCFICGHLQFQICFTSAQQRVTKAGLRPPSLERLVCKLSAGLVCGNLEVVPSTPTDRRGSLWLGCCANGVADANHLPASWEPVVWVCAGQQLLPGPAPSKMPGQRVSKELLVDCSHEEAQVPSCVTPERTLEVCAWSPRCRLGAFPLCGGLCILLPGKLQPWDGCVLSPDNPPSK